MKGLTLVRRRFVAVPGKSDHEHCEFCSGKFSEAVEDLHVGYASEDSYRWICPPCFEDFREEFGWSVRVEHDDA